jgi:biotin operon repressor
MRNSAATVELDRLADVERQMASLDLERIRLIARAQQHGASWEAIGAKLGITRQAAWETYRDRVRQMLHAVATDLSEDETFEAAEAGLAKVRARRRAGR